MADWVPPEVQAGSWQPPEAAKAKAASSPDKPGLFSRVGQFASDFAAASREDVAKHQGQSLAQRVLDPEGMRKAEEVAFSFGPSNLAVARAAAAPSARALAASDRLADFQKTGVTPNVPAVGQGRVSGLAANIGRLLPFSPVESGIRRNLTEAQASSSNLANQLGQPALPSEAGAVAKNAMMRFAEDTSQADRDFGRFYRLMQGAPPAKLPKTVKMLHEIMGRFPTAPGLEGLFTSSPLAKLRSELEPRQVQVPAKTSPIVGASGAPIVKTPATTITKGGELTVPELKLLRTQLGYQLNRINFGPEQIPKAEVRRLYGALSEDIEAAAKAQGSDALKAYRTANFNYGTRMKLIDELEPLVREGQASPESVFRRLNSAAEDRDAGLLVTAKKVLDPQEWGQVGASIVQKLGRPTPGMVNLAQPGVPFSVATYVTNWSKLSDKAKDLLFGKLGTGTPREGLDALARVTSSLRNVEKLANVSHSGEFVNVARTIETVFAALAAGSFPWATGLGLTGAYGTAKLMMSPKFTSWLYSLPAIAARAKSMPEATRIASEALRRTLLPAAASVYPLPPQQGPYSDTMRRAAQPVPQQP